VAAADECISSSRAIVEARLVGDDGLIGARTARLGALAHCSTAANRPFQRSSFSGCTDGAASSGAPQASVPGVEFSRELRSEVLAGDITISIRLWKRSRVTQGGHYQVGLGEIEVDSIERVPFAAITEDVRRAGEPDRERLRHRRRYIPADDETCVCLSEGTQQ
jgi:hypothetical protein